MRMALPLLAASTLLAQPAFLRKDISVGDGAMGFTVGDFNGDGRPDLALRSWACRLPSAADDPGPRQRCPNGTVGGVITVLLNTGGGSFAPPLDTVIDLDIPFFTYPFAADLNGDGKLDLLGRDALGTVRFLPGRGNGAFLPPRQIQRGYIVATGDFNGDRIPDLLFGRDPVFPPFDPANPPPRPPTPPLEVLLGNGEGYFLTSARIEFPGWTHVADFNGDGRSDLATRSETPPTLAIHLAQADGTLRAPVRTLIDSPQWLLADFNRDGLPDLATTTDILLGKGDGSFRPPRPYAFWGGERHWYPPAAAADFTGDGHMDLAVAHEGDASEFPGSAFSLFAGRGDGTFAPRVVYRERWPGGETADLDGDGRADLVRGMAYWYNTLSLLLFRPGGGPALRRAVSAASGTAIVAPGSLASIYLPTSATTTERAAATPWPTRLAGITLEVRDKAGAARLAPLIYVSPEQINFQVPPATALGEASLAIVGDGGPTLAGGMQVDAAAPALFLVTHPGVYEDNNVPVPAAVGVRVASDGRQTPVPVFMCSFPGAICAPARIPLPPAGDPTYLSFFGTGFRGANPANVTCTINGVRVPVEYAGTQGTPGLDQINIRLLPEVRGQPPLVPFGFVTISIDGVAANTASLFFN